MLQWSSRTFSNGFVIYLRICSSLDTCAHWAPDHFLGGFHRNGHITKKKCSIGAPEHFLIDFLLKSNEKWEEILQWRSRAFSNGFRIKLKCCSWVPEHFLVDFSFDSNENWREMLQWSSIVFSNGFLIEYRFKSEGHVPMELQKF